ncbi:MAG TPA: Rab family GTPase [Candidatus Lokiarchaeia archaeon]
MEEVKFKICILGDSSVGKTTLVNRYLTGLFKDPSKTLGADFLIKYLDVSNKRVFLQIWDFAGEERFRFILPSYVQGASGCIFMYDITNCESLAHFQDWYKVFLDGTNQSKQEIPFIMVGGKLDLDFKRSISKEDANNVEEQYNLDGYLECSSKTGENVEEIFVKITKIMLQKVGLI